MSNLKNNWIGFFDRTYDQAKVAILSRLGTNVPEMSDHTSSNPFIVILDVFMGLSELLHYYIDNIAREVFLHSARQYKSAQKIAKLFNYRLKSYSASSALLNFSIEQPHTSLITIPSDTIVSAGEIEYRTLETVSIPIGGTEVTAIGVQKTSATVSFISDATNSQKFELPLNTVDKDISVTVNSIQYVFKEDFYLSNSTDNHFITEISEDQKLYIIFGDGSNGLVPILNSNIVVNYYTCIGADGNVAIGEIDTIVTELNLPVALSVTNTEYATGGAGIEDLDTLKKKIPASVRTLNRAVTKQDFKDIAESHSGVSQADANYECGAAVDIYIIPTGLGGATSVLINSVKELFYDESRLIMMDVNIKSAGRVSALISIDLKVSDFYNRSKTTQLVKDNLKTFLSSKNQKISGSVYLGDIYQIIENTEGVQHCEIKLLSTVPEPTNKVGDSTLIWQRKLNTGSEITHRWEVKFIGNNKYELRKNNTFLGVFDLGVEINTVEVTFTISSGVYAVGDAWEFVTYKYNGSINLNEPSIITVEESNINITATGGV